MSRLHDNIEHHLNEVREAVDKLRTRYNQMRAIDTPGEWEERNSTNNWGMTRSCPLCIACQDLALALQETDAFHDLAPHGYKCQVCPYAIACSKVKESCGEEAYDTNDIYGCDTYPCLGIHGNEVGCEPRTDFEEKLYGTWHLLYSDEEDPRYKEAAHDMKMGIDRRTGTNIRKAINLREKILDEAEEIWDEWVQAVLDPDLANLTDQECANIILSLAEDNMLDDEDVAGDDHLKMLKLGQEVSIRRVRKMLNAGYKR